MKGGARRDRHGPPQDRSRDLKARIERLSGDARAMKGASRRLRREIERRSRDMKP